MTNDSQFAVTAELVASVDTLKRAERKQLLRNLAQLYPSVPEAIADISARLNEKRTLVQLWRCADPRTIPPSKLKTLLKSYL